MKNKLFVLLLISGSAFFLPASLQSQPSTQPDTPEVKTNAREIAPGTVPGTVPVNTPASSPASAPTSQPASFPVILPEKPTLDSKELPAPPAGVVDVYVVGATGEKQFVPNVEVMALLYAKDSQGGGEPEERLTQKTDQNGLARVLFQNPEKDKIVRVFARYDSTLVQGTPFLMKGNTGSAVSIGVYNRSPDTSKIHLGAESFVGILFNEKILTIEQVIAFENHGDTAYVPKNGTLKIPLPSGVFGISPLKEISSDISIKVEGGETRDQLFVDLSVTPIQPGKTILAFRYHLEAGDESDIELNVPLPFPASNGFSVLVQNDPEIEGLEVKGFSSVRATKNAGLSFLEAKGTPTGQNVSILIEGAPYKKPLHVPVALGLGIVIFLIGGFLVFVLPAEPKENKKKKASVNNNNDEKNKLFDTIVSLERDFANGKISENRYKKKREDTVKKLIALSRRSL